MAEGCDAGSDVARVRRRLREITHEVTARMPERQRNLYHAWAQGVAPRELARIAGCRVSCLPREKRDLALLFMRIVVEHLSPADQELVQRYIGPMLERLARG